MALSKTDGPQAWNLHNNYENDDYNQTYLEPCFEKLEWHENIMVSYFEACPLCKFNDKKPYYCLLFFAKLILQEKKW